MGTVEEKGRRTHHGHSVGRIRKSQGMKQSTLGELLGVSQQTISDYEQKQVIEDNVLEKIAAALSVSPEIIKNLEEDPLTLIFENNNTFENNEKVSNVGNYSVEDNSTNNFNPLDKIAELFERLLESEKEKIALLERILKEKK